MTFGIILSLFIVFFVKILLSCPPRKLVDWLEEKFKIHPKLDADKVTIEYEGKLLEGEAKYQFIDDFNEAIFLEKHIIFPGNEDFFLHPDNGPTPYVIGLKKGEKDVTLFVFSYNDRVDVVKQHKKKVVAYSLRSDHLQSEQRDRCLVPIS